MAACEATASSSFVCIAWAARVLGCRKHWLGSLGRVLAIGGLKEKLLDALPRGQRQTLLDLERGLELLQDVYARHALPHILAYSSLAASVGAVGTDKLAARSVGLGQIAPASLDATVFAATKYNYAVRAFDAAGNTSAASTAISVTTLPSSNKATLKGVTYYHTSTSTMNQILVSTTINLPYKGTNHFYTSNATTGAYNIIGIPPATYNVAYSKTGYTTKTLTITLTSGLVKTQNASLLKN